MRKMLVSKLTGRRLRGSALAVLILFAIACSEEALGDLGGRASGWIDEVVTTTRATTTTAPATTHSVVEVDWINDFQPGNGQGPEEVLSDVFDRSDGSSRFLQASRSEIAAVTPGVLFPTVIPAEVTYVSSQLVIESQSLTLATDPTVAFGLWSVEPYTRSRSIGQLAVLNVATDPAGAEAATQTDTEPTCTAFAQLSLCAIERMDELTVWRLESEIRVTHLWYDSEFRYELFTRGDLTEDVVHAMVGSLVPLAEIPAGLAG